MDAIGDTAYSERFALRTLLGLRSEDELAEEFVEKDLCALWDMSAEKDVSEFLARNGGFEALCYALSKGRGGRADEIAAGTLANVCCHPGLPTEDQIAEAATVVLPLAGSPDPATLVQAMRFAHSIVYEAEDADGRLALLEEADFPRNLAFAMENCLDRTALTGCSETLNCICASRERAEERFRRLFATEEIASGALAAHERLREIRRTAPDSDADDAERGDLLFLASHAALIDVAPDWNKLYGDGIERLLGFASEILAENVRAKKEVTEDAVEYVVGIVSASNCPLGEAAESIFETAFKLWKIVCETDDEEGNRNDDVKFDPAIVKPALVNYFVRIFKLWPAKKLHALLWNVPDEYVVRLIENVDSMLKDKTINENYGDIPSLLKQFLI